MKPMANGWRVPETRTRDGIGHEGLLSSRSDERRLSARQVARIMPIIQAQNLPPDGGVRTDIGIIQTSA